MKTRTIAGKAAFCLLCMGLSILPLTAFSSEARHSSLTLNPMVEDLVDIADFPGLTGAYRNSIYLNIAQSGTTIPDGNAGFLIGDTVVAGAWINRTPRFNDFEKIEDLYNFDLPTVHNIADLFLGTKIGFGLRLSLSTGLLTQDSQYSTEDDELYSQGQSAFGMEITPGFSFETPRYHGDFGLGISFSAFEVAVQGRSAFKNKWIPSTRFRHRSIIGPQQTTAWVIDLSIDHRAYGAEAQGENTADGMYNHVIGAAVVGPRIALPKDVTFWGGLRLMVEHLSGEVASFPTQKQTAIGVPGVLLSTEVEFLEYFAFRAGVNYDIYWAILSTPDSADTDGDDDRDELIAKRRTVIQRFNWSTGLGVNLDGFQIDGTVSQDLYLTGPNVIGGGTPGFLGMLSATYMW